MAGYIGSKSSVTLVDGYTETEADAEFVNDPNGAITVSGSNVGIGNTIPSSFNGGANNLVVGSGSGAEGITIYGGAESNIFFADGTSTADNLKGRIEYAHSIDGMRIYTNGSEAMRIDSSGRVGIGTSSFNAGRGLTVANGAISVTSANLSHTTSSLVLSQNDSSLSQIRFYGANTSTAGILQFNGSSSDGSVGGERMRIDSSGNVLVGTTDTQPPTNNDASGIALRTDGKIAASRSNGISGDFNNGSDGDIVWFRKAGNVVGYIGTISDSLYIGTTYSNDSALRFSTNTIHPCTNTGSPRDNAIQLGYSSARFNDIYATNGTIQTSDFNEKQDIASLTAKEMLVGKRISALFKTFRWKDSVAEKGDNARTHTGVIAQDVQAAFTAEGLDAGDYALFISSTWWETQTEVPAVEAVAEVTDEDGNVTTEAVEAVDAYTRTDTYDTEDEAPEGATEKTRLGIRYPELLSFVAAYNEQRFASIEARLTALEA